MIQGAVGMLSSIPGTSPVLHPMRRPLCMATVCAMLVIAANGCSAQYVRSAPVLSTRPLPVQGLTRNVVVVSIDGLRPDAIEAAGASTLGRLMREGSYTLSASTIQPSKTLPSHT